MFDLAVADEQNGSSVEQEPPKTVSIHDNGGVSDFGESFRNFKILGSQNKVRTVLQFRLFVGKFPVTAHPSWKKQLTTV